MIGFTFAINHFLVKAKRTSTSNNQLEETGFKKCPFCDLSCNHKKK